MRADHCASRQSSQMQLAALDMLHTTFSCSVAPQLIPVSSCPSHPKIMAETAQITGFGQVLVLKIHTPHGSKLHQMNVLQRAP